MYQPKKWNWKDKDCWFYALITYPLLVIAYIGSFLIINEFSRKLFFYPLILLYLFLHYIFYPKEAIKDLKLWLKRRKMKNV